MIKFYVNALRQAKSSTLRMFTTPAWKPLIASPWQLWWTSNSCAFTGGWVRRSTLWMTLEGWVEVYPVDVISQNSPLFIYSERRIQVARQKNPNQTNGTNRFYFLPRSAQLINDYRRYAKYREINGGKLLQKNELTKSNYLSIIHVLKLT